MIWWFNECNVLILIKVNNLGKILMVIKKQNCHPRKKNYLLLTTEILNLI